jgi:hypothetical protein
LAHHIAPPIDGPNHNSYKSFGGIVPVATGLLRGEGKTGSHNDLCGWIDRMQTVSPNRTEFCMALPKNQMISRLVEPPVLNIDCC